MGRPAVVVSICVAPQKLDRKGKPLGVFQAVNFY